MEDSPYPVEVHPNSRAPSFGQFRSKPLQQTLGIDPGQVAGCRFAEDGGERSAVLGVEPHSVIL